MNCQIFKYRDLSELDDAINEFLDKQVNEVKHITTNVMNDGEDFYFVVVMIYS